MDRPGCQGDLDSGVWGTFPQAMLIKTLYQKSDNNHLRKVILQAMSYMNMHTHIHTLSGYIIFVECKSVEVGQEWQS